MRESWRVIGCAFAAILALVGAAGCYRSHALGSEALDASPLDASIPDSPERWDASARDGGQDAGAPASPCLSDGECASPDHCVHAIDQPPRDLAAVPLRCADTLGVGAPGARCERIEDCLHGLCALAGSCVAPCRSDANCGADQRCGEVWVTTSGSSLQHVQACVGWVDPPPGVLARVEPPVALPVGALTSLAVAPMRGTSELVFLVADVSDRDRFVTAVRTGAGEQVFDAYSLTTRRQPLLAVAIDPHVGMLVPSGDRDFPAGTSFVIDLATGARRATIRPIVLERVAPADTLDLSLYYLDATAPGEAIPPADVVELVTRFGAILETIGLRLGEVRHVVVPGATARRFSVIDDDGEIADLLPYSAGAGRPVLNVFFVRTSSDFYGIAGGAPGAQAIHGLSASGVVLALEDIRSAAAVTGPAFPAMVLAHEVGHFLGLLHTTEMDGTVFEPLSDTPECDLATHDRDGDGVLLPDECVGVGPENLLFWGGFAPGAGFSPRQAEILRNGMVLR